MRMSCSVATRYAAAIGCGLLYVLLHPQHAAAGTIDGDERQTVVVVLGRNVLEHRLPDVMSIGHGRFLSAHDVERACATPGLTADRTLLFFPDSKTCERVSDQNLISLPFRLQKLTGRWQSDDPLARVQSEPFVTIAPVPHSPDQVLAMCGCSVDQPPDGVSTCSGQTRTAGSPIGSVEFLATDVDSPTLTGAFSYQRDSDPAEEGLPPEITSSCSSGSGTLQCTLTGTAPAPAGLLQFTFDVSDGTFSLPLETRLEVLAVGDRVFADNFEVAGCP
jgi:hypothetical protein